MSETKKNETKDATASTLMRELYAVDDGRFTDILDTFRLSEECLKCGYLNPKADNKYRCAVSPSCIGITLSQEIKSYLLWKIGVISEKEKNNNGRIR